MSLRDELSDEEDDWGQDESLDDSYLTFTLAGEEYAVGLGNVNEIVQLPDFMQVPDVPEFVRGVINLRGSIIPVIDARMRLGLERADYNDRTVAIVLESDGVATGLIADGVSGVTHIPASAIDPPPRSYGSGRAGGSVVGIGKLESAIAIIVDAAKLLGNSDETPSPQPAAA